MAREEWEEDGPRLGGWRPFAAPKPRPARPQELMCPLPASEKPLSAPGSRLDSGRIAEGYWGLEAGTQTAGVWGHQGGSQLDRSGRGAERSWRKTSPPKPLLPAQLARVTRV